MVSLFLYQNKKQCINYPLRTRCSMVVINCAMYDLTSKHQANSANRFYIGCLARR
jgi:hypothetical protein